MSGVRGVSGERGENGEGGMARLDERKGTGVILSDDIPVSGLKALT